MLFKIFLLQVKLNFVKSKFIPVLNYVSKYYAMGDGGTAPPFLAPALVGTE